MTLRIEHEPLGVVLDIAAWNYPLLVPASVVVPALVAGNAVILKHSPLTPLCGLAFERAFGTLSVPGLVQNLVVENERAEALIGDPRIDHVSFTGSVATGRRVYAAAAKRLIDAGLELGGKDPAYVAEDADIAFAAENVIDGACYNAGQSCCAVERVYVHESVLAAFLEKAKSALKQYRMGDPLDERTTLGPLARSEAVGFLEKQVEDAVARDAKIVFRGKRPSGKGSFFEPVLLSGVPNDASAMQEESFGPIVPVASVASDEEAIARMNDSRFGLTASVWTTSGERAERIARELEAGTVYQNRCDYLDPALPWSGWKESGIGSTLSRYGYLGLTKRKSIHFRG
jgi:acyl-CoA reductase-like NAD-dependent aldehyde dehydrogenase